MKLVCKDYYTGMTLRILAIPPTPRKNVDKILPNVSNFIKKEDFK